MNHYTTLKNNNKVNPHLIKANWSLTEKRAPWDLITSPELASILNVHLQTVANWRIRGILPPPEPATKRLKGNVVRYRISAIRAWIEGSGEEQIIWDWIHERIPDHNFKTIDQAKWLVQHCYKLMHFEKPRCS